MSKKTKKTIKIDLNQQEDEETAVEPDYESTESESLSAEEVTQMAKDFLKNLGHKRTNPTKVVQEGIHYVIEVDLKNKNAMVVVDANAKEIKEFEINDVKKGPKISLPFSISPKMILLIGGIQIVIMMLINLLGGYLPIPFL